MSKIKSKNTKCEMALQEALISVGLKNFKRHFGVVGRPDFAFPKKKIAVFCDSDFWHGKKNVPKTNQVYWTEKFEHNKKRDMLVNKELKKTGWKIVRFSEMAILCHPNACAKRVKSIIKNTL